MFDFSVYYMYLQYFDTVVRDGVFLVDPVDGVCDILLCVGPFSYLIFNYLN